MTDKPSIPDQEIEALQHRIFDTEMVLSQLRIMLAKKITEHNTMDVEKKRHAA